MPRYCWSNDALIDPLLLVVFAISYKSRISRVSRMFPHHVAFSLQFLYCSIFILFGAVTNATTDPSKPGDPPAYPSSTDPSTQNALGTKIFGWEKCIDVQNKAIREAYYDLNRIAGIEDLYRHIDFNSAAALELLGPPGYLDTESRDRIQGLTFTKIYEAILSLTQLS